MRQPRELPILADGYGAAYNRYIMEDGIMVARLIMEGKIAYKQLVTCLREGMSYPLTRENYDLLITNGLADIHTGFSLYQVLKRAWCVLQGYAVEGGNPTPSLDMLASQLHTVDMDTIKAWWDNIGSLEAI